MAGTRASDADRDAHVEIIEAAYVDGRLNDIEREIRVESALRATTRRELARLVRDLAPPPAPRPDRPAAAAPAKRGPAALVVAAVAALVLALGSLVFALVFTTTTPTSSTRTGAPDPVTVPEVRTDGDRLALHTRDGFTTFLDRLRAEAGTTIVDGATFYPDYASVTVVLPDQPTRTLTYSYRDGFSGDPRKGSRNEAFGDPIDLAEIDIDALVRETSKATTGYGVEDVTSLYVVIDDRSDQPAFSVYVSNEFSESGYRSFTLDGRELYRYPS